MISVISAGRYELAIPISEKTDEAYKIAWLCLIIIVCFSAGTTAIVLITSQSNFFSFGNQIPLIAWLLPIGVLSLGVYRVLNYLVLREKKFSVLSAAKLFQSAIGVFTSIILFPFFAAGLFAGQIICQSAGSVVFIKKQNLLKNLYIHRPDSTHDVVILLKKYRHFGLFSSIAGLINSCGNQLPNLIILSAFSTTQLGKFYIAQRILLSPATLIGNSVGQILLSRTSDSFRNNKLTGLIIRTISRLFIISLLICSTIYLLFLPLIEYILGDDWVELAEIVPLLMPIFIGQMTISPISACFLGMQKNKLELFGQIILMLARVLPLFLFSTSLPLEELLLLYSCCTFVGYLAYGFIMFYTCTRSTDHVAS